MNNIEGFALDLDKIFEFIAKDDNSETIETEITDGLDLSDNNIEAKTKVIRELKSKGQNGRDNIRYDLIKYLISVVIDSYQDDIMTEGLENNIAFNTLLCNKMIKQIDNE